MAGPFDGLGQFPLVFYGRTGDAAGQNLALLVHKFQQEVRVLVIDVFNAQLFEAAIFFLFDIHRDGGEISDFAIGLLCAHNLNLFKGYYQASAVSFLARSALFFSLYAIECLFSTMVRKRITRSSRLKVTSSSLITLPSALNSIR